MTGPRRLPRWTVPDGVLESLTICGPVTEAASSSAQSIAPPCRLGRPVGFGCAEEDSLADRDDLVGEVARGDLHDDLLALLLAEEGAPDRALVADPALGGLGLCGPDDRELLLAVLALDVDRRADLDVVRGVVLVDDRGVLDQRLECLDPALDERLLVLGVLVLGVLAEVAVLLGVVDALSDLGPLDADHLIELGAKLLEAVLGQIRGLVVHVVGLPDGDRSAVGLGFEIKERTPGSARCRRA